MGRLRLKEKFYSWECPYCNFPAKGNTGGISHHPYTQNCAFCGYEYKRGLDDGKFYVTAKMENLLRYLAGIVLQEYDRRVKIPGALIEYDKMRWCADKLKEKLFDRYAYIGSFDGLLKLDILY